MSGIQMALMGSLGLPLSITISPASLYNTRSGPGSLTSAPATGVAVGGSGGYSYAWTYESGDSFTINSPASATTTFTTLLLPTTLYTGVYRCTVTDSSSNTASQTITVQLESV